MRPLGLPLQDAEWRHGEARRLLWAAIFVALASAWWAWHAADLANPWAGRSVLALLALVGAGIALYGARQAERRAWEQCQATRTRFYARLSEPDYYGRPDDD